MAATNAAPPLEEVSPAASDIMKLLLDRQRQRIRPETIHTHLAPNNFYIFYKALLTYGSLMELYRPYYDEYSTSLLLRAPTPIHRQFLRNICARIKGQIHGPGDDLYPCLLAGDWPKRYAWVNNSAGRISTPEVMYAERKKIHGDPGEPKLVLEVCVPEEIGGVVKHAAWMVRIGIAVLVFCVGEEESFVVEFELVEEEEEQEEEKEQEGEQKGEEEGQKEAEKNVEKDVEKEVEKDVEKEVEKEAEKDMEGNVEGKEKEKEKVYKVVPKLHCFRHVTTELLEDFSIRLDVYRLASDTENYHEVVLTKDMIRRSLAAAEARQSEELDQEKPLVGERGCRQCHVAKGFIAPEYRRYLQQELPLRLEK